MREFVPRFYLGPPHEFTAAKIVKSGNITISLSIGCIFAASYGTKTIVFAVGFQNSIHEHISKLNSMKKLSLARLLPLFIVLVSLSVSSCNRGYGCPTNFSVNDTFLEVVTGIVQLLF